MIDDTTLERLLVDSKHAELLPALRQQQATLLVQGTALTLLELVRATQSVSAAELAQLLARSGEAIEDPLFVKLAGRAGKPGPAVLEQLRGLQGKLAEAEAEVGLFHLAVASGALGVVQANELLELARAASAEGVVADSAGADAPEPPPVEAPRRRSSTGRLASAGSGRRRAASGRLATAPAARSSQRLAQVEGGVDPTLAVGGTLAFVVVGLIALGMFLRAQRTARQALASAQTPAVTESTATPSPARKAPTPWVLPDLPASPAPQTPAPVQPSPSQRPTPETPQPQPTASVAPPASPRPVVAADGWVEYQGPGYRMELFMQPTPSSETRDTPVGKVKLDMAVAQPSAALHCSVIHATYPEGVPLGDPDACLQQSLQSMIAGVGGLVVQDTKQQALPPMAGATGREVKARGRISGHSMVIHARAYIRGQETFDLLFIASEKAYRAEDEQRIFDSFTLTD